MNETKRHVPALSVAGFRRQRGFNASRVGDLNRGLVIEAIRQRPGIGRTHISAETGLTPSAITQIVAALMDEGLVEEVAAADAVKPEGQQRLGQPIRGLRIIPGYAATIGLHFDHEFARAVLVDVAGNIIAREKEQLQVEEPDQSTRLLAALFSRLDEHPQRPGRLLGVGVSVMGPVDHERGAVGLSSQYPAWRSYAFEQVLSQTIGHRVFIAINGSAAGLGEYWFGGGRHLGSYIYAFVGYGLGGALIFNRRAVRGSYGNAGEIGHIHAYPDGEVCYCGARGCLETVVSLRGLARFLGKARVEDLDFNAPGFCDDPELGRWIEQAGTDLGRSLTSVSNIVDISNILVSGLLPEPVLDRLIERTRRTVAVCQITARPKQITLEKAQAPSELVAALGAAAMPLYGNLF
ncbi:ROK family transcriptional regulator [Labrys miyagiensis]|uniref:ROK family transcriptional regulator n=1 Tax=Labrys miyagiensis TaxID=346912 RepID=UPI0024E142AB|nr:ROK family transcriptional regulator [Labrys miyagiensis]